MSNHNGLLPTTMSGNGNASGGSRNGRSPYVLRNASHVDADHGSSGGLTNLQPGFRHGGSYNLLSAAVDFVF